MNNRIFNATLSRIAALPIVLTLLTANVDAAELELKLELKLERSADLRDWVRVPVTGEMLSDDGTIRLPAEGSTGFFRLSIVTEPDPVPDGFSLIPAGTFTMGSPEDEPVTRVNWHDAVKWLNAKSEKEGLAPAYRVDGAVYRSGENNDVVCDFDATGYRLPTEAEWECAARAGTTTAFYSGTITHTASSPVDPNLDRIGWYSGNSGLQTRPVGQKQSNTWGLYDMAGNVYEWCWDWGQREYTPLAVTDPIGRPSGSYRMFRGGGWFSSAWRCRSAFRLDVAPDHRNNALGFRAARSE